MITSQGIERLRRWQMSYLALDHDLDVTGFINKIDLPSADPDHVEAEIERCGGLEAHVRPVFPRNRAELSKDVLETVCTRSVSQRNPVLPFRR